MPLVHFSEHLHEVCLAFVAWNAVALGSQWLSPRLFPRAFATAKKPASRRTAAGAESIAPLDARGRVNWHTRVVSLVHSVWAICAAATLLLRHGDRLFGPLDVYVPAAGRVHAISLGYFAYDLVHCLLHYQLSGFPFALHAFCSGLVYLLSFRPYLMYWGAVFLSYELSTPFLNVHWFCDKLGLSASRLSFVNGLSLVGTFFVARLLLGIPASLYVDWRMVKNYEAEPLWLVAFYLASNVAMNWLNLLWFHKLLVGTRQRLRLHLKTQQAVHLKREE